jgi:hypothetical protein
VEELEVAVVEGERRVALDEDGGFGDVHRVESHRNSFHSDGDDVHVLQNRALHVFPFSLFPRAALGSSWWQLLS